MEEKKNVQTSIPKKYQPKGLTILFEDQHIIVVNKNNGLLTVSTASEKEKTAHYILNDYVRKGNARSRNRVYIVHRLDRDTSGVLVFAKSENGKKFLQDNWQDFSKTYYAVVEGQTKEKEGIIESYLTENKAYQVYSVKDPAKGKLSKTGYKTVKSTNYCSLLSIELFTGRKNQIRVHMSDLGNPIVGDKVYGNSKKPASRLALHSASLTIAHPVTKKKMTFETDVPSDFMGLVSSRKDRLAETEKNKAVKKSEKENKPKDFTEEGETKRPFRKKSSKKKKTASKSAGKKKKSTTKRK